MDLLNETSVPRIDEAKLTPTTTSPSPFLPGTNVQFAWDSTSLGLIKTCPRLYQYTMILGYQPRDESVHLRFGQEYHSALENFDHLLAQGTHREEAVHSMVRTAFLRTKDWVPDRTTKAGKYKNPESLLGLLVDYVDHFNPDPATTYIKSDGAPAVELSFRYELDWGPSEANQIQPYLLCGHLDRVVRFNSQLLVMDRKTTTTSLTAHYFSQYSPNNQMSLYTFAGRIVLNATIDGVIIDAAQIKLDEPNAFARGFTFRTEAQLEEWLVDLRHNLELAELYAVSNYWPMNDTSCDKFGGCRFREICKSDPHVRPAFLKTNFNQLEPEHRWNPLRAR